MNSPLGLVLVVVGADGMEGNASASCRAMLLGVTGGGDFKRPLPKGSQAHFFSVGNNRGAHRCLHHRCDR